MKLKEINESAQAIISGKKLEERLDDDYENPFVDKLISELEGVELVVKKTLDSLHPEGTRIELSHPDEGKGIETYFRGHSSNPHVGSDIWSVNWVIDGLMSGSLDIDGDDDEENKKLKKLLIKYWDKAEDYENEKDENEAGDDEEVEESVYPKDLRSGEEVWTKTVEIKDAGKITILAAVREYNLGGKHFTASITVSSESARDRSGDILFTQEFKSQEEAEGFLKGLKVSMK